MLREYFSMAFRSLLTHKARAFLTMLGVIIGVSSVILLMSLGNSAKTEAAKQIRGLGSNLVMVSVTDPQGYLPKNWLDNMKDKAKINQYSPIINGSVTYKIDGTDFDASITGVNEHYSEISTIKLAKGRFFFSLDVENNSPVAVIGTKVKDALFPYKEAIGETVIIKGIPFKVIGVMQVLGTSFNGDLDKGIYIPSNFASTLFTSMRGTKSYYVASLTEADTDITKAKIDNYLKEKLPSDKLYRTLSQSQILSALDTIMGLLTSLLAGIAAISLVVGGIGIMNIMLVTVRERTKEIGIRKALGARKSYILLQFLVEAVIITVIGGLIGLGFSELGALAVTQIANFPVTLGLSSIILAIAFSIIVGVFFGIYPAYKAGELEPVEAFRFE